MLQLARRPFSIVVLYAINYELPRTSSVEEAPSGVLAKRGQGGVEIGGSTVVGLEPKQGLRHHPGGPQICRKWPLRGYASRKVKLQGRCSRCSGLSRLLRSAWLSTVYHGTNNQSVSTTRQDPVGNIPRPVSISLSFQKLPSYMSQEDLHFLHAPVQASCKDSQR